MKKIHSVIIIAALVLSGVIPVYADGTHPQGIRLDGSIGTAGKIDLPGPDYAIKPEYGKQAGSNLFHSFQQFNIHSGESATFSGPASVQNIISRVTGGSASWIDGRLATTIPGADLYFLNPSGVMFGSNASLDLSGSFHLSTADYLKMGDNERFYSQPIANEVLSVAAPSAFGFLSDKPAKISVDGANFKVSNGKIISFIGGDIEIYDSTLTASGGQIIIDGKKDVSLIDSAIFIESTSLNSGSLFIRSGQIFKFSGGEHHNSINAHNILDPDVGNADLDLQDLNDGGNVDIQADSISIISASVNSAGAKGGNINLKANDSISVIESVMSSTGASGGNLTLKANKSVSFEKSKIETSNAVPLNPIGTIEETREEFIGSGELLYCRDIGLGLPCVILYGPDYSTAKYGDNAGNIIIEAKNISFTNGSINSTTIQKGNGGEIILKASESVSFAGKFNSGINISTSYKEEGAGDAGRLLIEAKNISFTDGISVDSKTYGNGKGGEIILKAAETITLSGDDGKGNTSSINAGAENAGAGGKIFVSAQKLQISDKGEITTSSKGGGQAGDISLNVGSLELRGGASVSSDATLSGGGRITIDAKDTVHLSDSSITTNVSSGIEKGGDITIGKSETGTGSRFVILNRSNIQANAHGKGDGGAVFIQTDNFLKSADSSVTATSSRGNQGTVKIEAPDLDLSGALLLLSGNILDAAQFAPTPCDLRSGRSFSSFVIRGFDAIPAPPDDLQPMPLSEADAEAFSSEETDAVSEYLNLSDYFKLSPSDKRCEGCDRK